MIGTLEFLIENPEVLQNAFDARGQFISRYFNLLGGTKPLAFMDKSYFKSVLNEIKPRLMSIKSIQDVQNRKLNLE